MPILTLVRGLPGSGKSTFAKTLNCFHLESDNFFVCDGKYLWDGNSVKRAHEFTKKIAELIMKEGCDLVVSNTFTQLWEIEDYLKLAGKYKYNFAVHRMNSNYGNIHFVPDESLLRMQKRFQDYPGEIIHV